MNYKTHLAGGVLLGIASMSPVSAILQVDISPLSTVGAVYMVSSMAGSLFPDLDHRGSYLSRRMKLSSMIISNMFSHRGATHSPILLTIGTTIAYLLSKLYYIGELSIIIATAFLLGALSHVFLDWFTKGGVPMFMPISKKKYSLLKMSSGKAGEKIVFMTCISLACILLVYKMGLSILII